MNLDRLELFVAIVDAGSLTAAAQRVHVTQPAASRNLKVFEEELGVELFERVGRGLVLTAAGRALVPRARDLLRRVDEGRREVRRAARDRYFDLRLGTVDSIATYLLPQLSLPLREAFPGLRLTFRTARTRDLLSKVERGELDLAIIASLGKPVGFRAQLIGPYDMQYYGHREQFPALHQVRDETELVDYPIVELIALPGQPTMIGQRTPSSAQVSSLATVKAMILGGFGVGALLHFMLTDLERAQLLRSQVPHDPNCGLFVVGSPYWTGEMAEAIESKVLEGMRDVFPRP